MLSMYPASEIQKLKQSFLSSQYFFAYFKPSKSDQYHIYPLSPLLLEILQQNTQSESQYYFPYESSHLSLTYRSIYLHAETSDIENVFHKYHPNHSRVVANIPHDTPHEHLYKSIYEKPNVYQALQKIRENLFQWEVFVLSNLTQETCMKLKSPLCQALLTKAQTSMNLYSTILTRSDLR